MGFLFVKVIEAKTVAVTTSLYPSYPYIRVSVGRTKKSTSCQAGVEQWNKIFSFRSAKGDIHEISVQARNKSTKDQWIGELKLDLDAQGFLDGRVHQMWYKFGSGSKPRRNSPRGYVHLAFQYVEFTNFLKSSDASKDSFAETPVEKVMSFDEWFANNHSASLDSLPPSYRRESAPPRFDGASSNSTVAMESPTRETLSASASSYHDDSDSNYDSDSVPCIGLVVDLSFDDINDAMQGHHTHAAENPCPPVQSKEPINAQPDFSEWYHQPTPVASTFKPTNPFLGMQSNPPTYSMLK